MQKPGRRRTPRETRNTRTPRENTQHKNHQHHKNKNNTSNTTKKRKKKGENHNQRSKITRTNGNVRLLRVSRLLALLLLFLLRVSRCLCSIVFALFYSRRAQCWLREPWVKGLGYTLNCCPVNLSINVPRMSAALSCLMSGFVPWTSRNLERTQTPFCIH